MLSLAVTIPVKTSITELTRTKPLTVDTLSGQTPEPVRMVVKEVVVSITISNLRMRHSVTVDCEVPGFIKVARKSYRLVSTSRAAGSDNVPFFLPKQRFLVSMNLITVTFGMADPKCKAGDLLR